MGLVKINSPNHPLEENDSPEDHRARFRGPGGLLEQLSDPRAVARRWAIRELAAFPESVNVLLAHLPMEPDNSVREVMLTTLMAIGGETVVKGLIAYLRSEDVFLRNGVVEVLQALPNELAVYMDWLLRDPDPDVRIFAVDILRELAHPEAPAWLEAILAQETEINVCGSVVDCLSEIGAPQSIPALQKLLIRFAGQPFLEFAVSMAIERIQNGK